MQLACKRDDIAVGVVLFFIKAELSIASFPRCPLFTLRPSLSGCNRYVLLNLLGKGGFSEVWRAFDLVLAQDVAVKVKCARAPCFQLRTAVRRPILEVGTA